MILFVVFYFVLLANNSTSLFVNSAYCFSIHFFTQATGETIMGCAASEDIRIMLRNYAMKNTLI